jgi:methionine aminopeptidase
MVLEDCFIYPHKFYIIVKFLSNIFYLDNDYKGRMEPGNVFTIEPIILMRHGEYIMWKDKFTVVSPDNPSA